MDLLPTPANIKAAERLLSRVTNAIEAGLYEAATFFPRSDRASPTTFKDFGEAWLKTLTGAKSTKRSYRSALEGTWFPAIGDKRLTEIRHSDLKTVVAAKAAGVSGKTINNVLIPLREVFKAAVRDELIVRNPADGIKNHAHQVALPDPFEQDEADAAIAHLTAKYDPQVAAYFEFAIQTGMRPSEIIALCWADIDFKRRTARVSKARVDWEEKDTKTSRVRDVDLSDLAVAVLQRQKALTFLADAEVFHNPNTGKAWADEQVQRRRYFNPTLKALGMRQRDAYQCRHTFATLMLMGGVNPTYIAKQLGHTNALMLFKVYGRWIDGADKGAEAAKANAILSRKSPREGTND